MPETNPTTMPQHGLQRCEIIHSVSVYQSAVPLRAVEVWDDHVTEYTVVGIQLTFQSEYARERHHADENYRDPANHQQADEDDWQFERQKSEHEVLLWDLDDNAASPISAFACPDNWFIVAPVNDPRWDNYIADAQDELIERDKAKKANA